MTGTPYGFRIVGPLSSRRRLVTADDAFRAYAACDERADVQSEAYLSAFQFGADFRTHLEQTGSTRDFHGPCWAPFLWFDLDGETLDGVLADARALASAVLDRYRALDDDGALLFFSGSKGFHLGIPTDLWQPTPSTAFHRAARRMAERLAGIARVSIDASVYDRVRAFRAPNSRHPKTGLHKRRLPFDALLGLSLDGIRGLTAQPEPFDLPTVRGTDARAVADWQDCEREVNEETTARAQQRSAAADGSTRLNRQTLDFIRDGADTGDRHRLLFSAAANLAEFGCPPLLAHALLFDAALDTGLAPSDVRRQIECGLNYRKGPTNG